VAYRPSHADATYDFKYGIRAIAGGGRSSARETIGRVAAGAVAKKILKLVAGCEVLAYVSQVKDVKAENVDHATFTMEQVCSPSQPPLPAKPSAAPPSTAASASPRAAPSSAPCGRAGMKVVRSALRESRVWSPCAYKEVRKPAYPCERCVGVGVVQVEANIVRCPDESTADAMIAQIDEVRNKGDSCGGVVTCVVRNCPKGLGAPVFHKLEADLAFALMSIPATKVRVACVSTAAAQVSVLSLFPSVVNRRLVLGSSTAADLASPLRSSTAPSEPSLSSIRGSSTATVLPKMPLTVSLSP
jgi:chorismate synthase